MTALIRYAGYDDELSGNYGRPPKYAWRDMKIGDSFIIDNPPKSIRRIVNIAGVRTGRKFSCTTIEAVEKRIIKMMVRRVR